MNQPLYLLMGKTSGDDLCPPDAVPVAYSYDKEKLEQKGEEFLATSTKLREEQVKSTWFSTSLFFYKYDVVAVSEIDDFCAALEKTKVI